MFKIMFTAFLCVIGASFALLLVVLLYRLYLRICDEMEAREKKAKTVLDDRDFYLKKQMFEELSYIKKYLKELEQGKWPSEMEEKFEYNEPESNVYVLEETEEGLFAKPKKRWLRLKDSFKHKKDDKNKVKDDKNKQ